MAYPAFEARNKVAVVGVGHSEVGRRLDGRPTGALAVEACRRAIADAGLTLNDIDGISTWPQTDGPGVGPVPGYSSAPISWMIEGLGMERVNWWNHGGGGNIAAAIGTSVLAIAAGLCDYVLVYRAMWQPRVGRGSGRRSTVELEANRARTAPRVSNAQAYSEPYGIGGPGGFASSYMRYMKMYGAKRHHLGAYATSTRSYANRNPNAVFYRQPMTMEDYMNCRMIADPLCLFDCDIHVDGAAAVVLARADRVHDLKQPPAYVTAYGTGGWDWRLRPPEEWQYASSGNIGRTLWASTDMTPKDIDGVEFYDGYAPDIYWWLESLGFCGRGEAFEFIQNGRIEQFGELPLNTFGGNVSEGRLHGIGHWVEATKQVQGRADDQPGDGARQIPDVENMLVATGMLGHGVGVILSKDPR
ncbi:MAG: hypothetical protein EXR68_02590 [Dehalococcoidia bacterium]|nr:hypothetical protein [Dehalococcoidia bacterium]